MLRKWEKLPGFMQVPELRPYYDLLAKKRISLFFKRVFDYAAACILLIVFLLPMLAIAVLVKLDSPGAVFYRQERVTKYGKRFKIHKFRTMVRSADKQGSSVTVANDSRITRLGSKLRRLRLDELPQLFDVLSGNMSFVGTRPEAVEYVKKYRSEYYATLLLPAGITSEASIRYKDEAALLDGAKDVEMVYVEKVLPEKMKWNLDSLRNFSFFSDLWIIVRTIFAVFEK